MYLINAKFIRDSLENLLLKLKSRVLYNIPYIQIRRTVSLFEISSNLPITINEKGEKQSKVVGVVSTVDASRTYRVLDNTFSRSSIAATSAYVNTRLNSYHSADRKWIHSANSGHVLVWCFRFANGVGSTLSTAGKCRRRCLVVPRQGRFQALKIVLIISERTLLIIYDILNAALKIFVILKTLCYSQEISKRLRRDGDATWKERIC